MVAVPPGPFLDANGGGGLVANGGERRRMTETQHSELGPVRYTVRELPVAPDAQVGETVGVMWRNVMQDSQRPEFRQWVGEVIKDAGYGADQVALTRAIWQHAHSGIRFQRDEGIGAGIAGIENPDDIVEVIVRPADMMRYVASGQATGDCDDFSQYAAAMLTACGVKCKFATVAASAEDPSQYSHVYVVAYPVDGATGEVVRMPVDASHGKYCGWEVPNEFGKYREWGEETGFWDGVLSVLGLVAISTAGHWLAGKLVKAGGQN